MASQAHKSRRDRITSQVWLCLAVAASTLPVALLVNRIVPNPYMDEIFHIPQAQQYCKGLFTSWDPMITTPPGLYFLSLLYTTVLFPTMKVMGVVSSLVDMCSPLVLRSLNVALAVICAMLFQNISIQLEPNISTKQTFLKALGLTWYPLHWFFVFLFYTDVGSTTAVMAMYLACLKGAYWTSGILGLVAILFRQTNAVWTVFVACVGMIDFLYKNSQTHQSFFQNLSRSDQSGQFKASVSMDSEDTKNGKRAPGLIEGLLREALFMLHQAWDQRVELMWNFFPFMLSTLCFLAFVGYNGSIVLGAKDAHKASLHLVQVLYFAAASALALAPMHLDSCLIKENFKAVNPFRRGVISYITAGLVGSMACVHFFSLAHPYLISDNRHYTFYIWRKVINPHWSAKYLLSIVYLYSWISIFAILGKRDRKAWLVIFCLALIAVLVPAPLIEFRYYTIPFYFIALHTPTNARKGYLAWLLICIQYSIVNLLTMYMFLFRPFFNPRSTEAERFIW